MKLTYVVGCLSIATVVGLCVSGCGGTADKSGDTEPPLGIVLATWDYPFSNGNSKNTLVYGDGDMVLSVLWSDSDNPRFNTVAERPWDNPTERRFDLSPDYDESEYIVVSATGQVRYYAWEGRQFKAVSATISPDMLSVGVSPVVRLCTPKDLSPASKKTLDLYRRLHEFKDDPQFAQMGFSAAGPYNGWLMDAQDAHGDREHGRKVLEELKFPPGDILMLGMNYMWVATRPSLANESDKKHIVDTERIIRARVALVTCATADV